MKILDWHNCYSGSLRGKIVDDAFQHPAKMAWGLTMRIFQHLFDEGWLKEGDLVADPFGGIGVTALAAASFGCPCILVELEEKFCKLAEENFELHKEQWEKMGKPRPVILQGDSRNFSSIIREAVSSIITSPPYAKGGKHPSLGSVNKDNWGSDGRDIVARRGLDAEYGAAEGQIGAMKEGKLDEVVAVLTSPPYAESLQPETEEQTRRKQERIAKAKSIHNGRALEKPSPGKAALGGGYGVSEGQLGAMKEGDFEQVKAVITSPAYGHDTEPHRSKPMEEWRGTEKWGGPHSVVRAQGYGAKPDNLGNLPEGDYEATVQGIVTPPPWEKTGANLGGVGNTPAMRQQIHDSVKRDKAYGATEGQLGQEQGNTYWEAVSQVYQECFKALRPGGIICVVVKDFVRRSQRVLLCDQTFELLQTIGFKPLERIKAWLVSEAEQKSLMPDVVSPYRKSRKSFFRRLAERKGSPEINWEEVLIFQRPNDNPGHNSLAP